MSKKLILGLLAMMVLSASMAQAGTLSVVDLPATGTDDAIDINSGKNYTHTFDFGLNAPVTINGVAFEQGPTATLSSVYTGTSSWGYGYTIDDTRRPMDVPVHAGNANVEADGSSNGLLRDMIYHGGANDISLGGEGSILILSDLTSGTTYSTRWYYRPWNVNDIRVITFKADGESNGIFSDTIELSIDAGGAHYLDYTFTADDTDVTLQFITHNDNTSAHIYGLSNEIVEPVTKAYGPKPTNGAIIEDTWANLGWTAGVTAVSHDVYFSDNYDDVNDGAPEAFIGNQVATFLVVGFPGFPYPDGLVPGTTYYWRIAEVEEDGTTIRGGVWSFSVPPKTAYAPDPADGAELVAPDVELSWTAGFGAKLHTVYFGDNFDEVDNAAGGLPQGVATYTPPGTLKMAKTYYWRVDEFDVIETHKGDVWSFTTEGAVGSPDPANGAVDVEHTPVLTWSPGVYAASHQIFFGADEDAVKNANTSSPEYKGSGNLGAESYEPEKLEWNSAYYWRIVEANNVNPDSPWTGPLWSFTTANFLIIDDFEGYNDLDPADPASNRIFNVWIDGFDNPAINGAVVGHANPPLAEQTIVHSGNQSMPMSYDNAVGKSEATMALTSNSDWTVKSVDTLGIWYIGDTANAPETMYVVLNDSAVVTNDNPDAALATTWTEWVIPLQTFADQGVNLANVTSITLGLGNRSNPVAGGTGMMYFDDIRLYAPAP
jgi:hypothetical protein